MGGVNYLQTLLSRIRPQGSLDLRGWRIQFIKSISLLSIFAFPIILWPSLLSFFAEGRYDLIAFDLGLWFILIGWFLFVPQRFYHLKAILWLVILYIMMVFYFVELGPNYARSGWLVLCVVMTTLLYGMWGTVVAAGVNTVILFLLYWGLPPQNPAWAAVFNAPSGQWTMFVANISLISLVTGLAPALMLDQLDHSLAEERESEMKYSRLFDSMMDAYVSVDLSGKIRDTNLIFRSMLGYSDDELRRLTYPELTPEKWHPLETAIVEKQILIQGYSAVYQKEYRKKDGTLFPVELRTFLLRDHLGQPSGMWAIVRDISERKQAEKALSESERMHRLLTRYHKHLNQISILFAGAPDLQDLFSKIAENFRFLTGAMASSFLVFNPENRVLKIVSLSIDQPMREKAEPVFRTGLLEISFPVSQEDLEPLRGRGIRRSKDLYELTSGGIPQDLSDAISQAIGCQHLMALPITCASELIGTCLAFLPTDQTVVPDDALNTYSHLAGLAVQRKRAEQDLQLSEQELRSYFNSAGDAIYVIDLKRGRILDCNQQALLQLGYTRNEILQLSTQDIEVLLKPDEIEKVHQRVRPEKTILAEGVHKRKDGSTFPVEIRLSPINSSQSQYSIAIVRDITGRKQAEVALRKSELRFRTLFEYAPMAISLTRSGIILYSNQKMRELFGMSLEDSVGGFITDYFAPSQREEREERIRRRLLGLPAPSEFESVGLRKDGSEFLMDVGLKEIQLEDGPANLTFVTDITERKRAEEDRVVMSKLESTGILAGGIAHDYNNLLSVILGNLELIKMSPLDGMTFPYLEAAEKAVLAARGLTRQLITFAKGGAPVKKKVALSGLLEEQVAFTLRGSPVGFNFSIPSDLWLTEVDETQIGQVIRNIALNAREAMPEGGMVSVTAENMVLKEPSDLSLPAGSYVKISISDQGGGIPKEILSKIFDPYYSTKQRGDQKGMGLGLTICHSVIQKHGGAIAGNSRTGEGTTFQIYLPALSEGLNEERAGSDRVTVLGRILVMDDEALIRNMISAMLSRMDYEAVLVEDGVKAVEVYRQATAQGRPFDAVILDLTVPGGMGGVKTIQELIQINFPVKAIVLSGYDNDPVLQNYERHGFRGALTKPFLFNDLKEILSRVIGRDN